MPRREKLRPSARERVIVRTALDDDPVVRRLLEFDGRLAHPRVSGDEMRCEGQRELPLPGRRRTGKAVDVVPASQAQGRRQRYRGASFDEMLCRGDVAIDERIVRRAVGRRAGINEGVDERDLNVTLSRDP